MSFGFFMASIVFRQHFLNRPLVVCHVRGLRWRQTVRAMLADEIEMRRENGDGVFMIGQFF